MRKILIAEDEEILRESYELILSTEPYQIFTASDGEEAFSLIKKTHFDLILLDIMMPKVDGLMFLERCKTLHVDLPTVIMLSNLSSGDELERAVSLGAHRTAIKADLSPKQLISLVRYELEAV